MRKEKAATGRTRQRPVPDRPFDEADWVDWDHWQTVEELQNFMDGLTDTSAESEFMNLPGEDKRRDHIARQILRHGLEIDG